MPKAGSASQPSWKVTGNHVSKSNLSRNYRASEGSRLCSQGAQSPPGGRGTVCKGLEFTRTVSTRCQGARRRARAIGHGGEGEGPQRKWRLSKWQLRCSRVAGMYFNIIVVRRGDNLLASSTVGMMAVWGQQPGLRKKPFCRFTQHIKNSQSTKGNIWEKEHFHSKFLWYALCVYSSN